jgi:hypothetical protein
VLAGTGTGERELESPPPSSAINAPDTATTASATTQEKRPVMPLNISETEIVFN